MGGDVLYVGPATDVSEECSTLTRVVVRYVVDAAAAVADGSWRLTVGSGTVDAAVGVRWRLWSDMSGAGVGVPAACTALMSGDFECGVVGASIPVDVLGEVGVGVELEFSVAGLGAVGDSLGVLVRAEADYHVGNAYDVFVTVPGTCTVTPTGTRSVSVTRSLTRTPTVTPAETRSVTRTLTSTMSGSVTPTRTVTSLGDVLYVMLLMQRQQLQTVAGV